jgi:hypothetical protein
MMINTWNVASLRSYEQAHEHFENTRYPARSKKWLSHQRPLRNTQSSHLRVEKHEVHGVPCYDLVLYETPLIRYFKPNADGERAVWLLNHYSCSSQKFLWNAKWWNGMKLTTDANQEIKLQLSGDASLAEKIWGDPFTCKLVFDAENRIILHKSAHIPFGRKVSTATHRAKRKRMREHFAMIFDMLEMQYQSFLEGVIVDRDEGRPFSNRKIGDLKSELHVRVGNCDYDALTADDMTHLMQFAQQSCKHIAQSIVNRRAYNFKPPSSARFDWGTFKTLQERGELPNDGAPLSFHTEAVRQALTPTWEDIRKAVDLDLQYIGGLASGDALTPYPQFAKTYARRCYSLRGRASVDLPNALGIEVYNKLVSRKGVVY